MTAKWKNTTARETNEIKGAELKLDSSKISIHKHIDNPGYWHLSCSNPDVTRKELKSKDLEEAKIEVIKILIDKLKPLLAELESHQATTAK